MAPAFSLVVAEHGAPLASGPTIVAPTLAQVEPVVRAEPAVAPRSEPTLVIRSASPVRPAAPVQGTLSMDLPNPAPRHETRIEPRMETRAEAKAGQVEPTPIGEPRRGFIGRLASHMRQASQTPSGVPAQTPAAPTPAPAQQPTRISPADRLPTSRAAEEDLLDIPAFLRRQAN
jgi:cell division protein FtsZ